MFDIIDARCNHEDSLKCLHEEQTLLHYVCVGTDSKNMNFLIYITNASVWTPVLRLWIMKCNTKLVSFAMELLTWNTVGRGSHLHMKDNEEWMYESTIYQLQVSQRKGQWN